MCKANVYDVFVISHIQTLCIPHVTDFQLFHVVDFTKITLINEGSNFQFDGLFVNPINWSISMPELSDILAGLDWLPLYYVTQL